MKTYLNPKLHYIAENDIYIFKDLEWIAESLPVKNGYYYKQDYYSAETNQQAVFYFDDSDKLVMIQFPFVSMH